MVVPKIIEATINPGLSPWCYGNFHAVDLIPDNLGKVRDLIISAQTKWIDLGLELHIKMTELEVIEKDRHDVDSRFREMLRTWLKMVDPSPSWEGLIVALEKESVGCDDVAEVVRQMLGVMKPIPESGQLFERISPVLRVQCRVSYPIAIFCAEM